MSESKEKVITVRLTEELGDFIEKRSRDLGISQNAVISIGVADLMKQYQTLELLHNDDMKDLIKALSALKAVPAIEESE